MSTVQKTQGMELPWSIPGWTTLEQTIERAKAAIVADAASGIVPWTCASFRKLYDYVDASGYGGAFNKEETDFWNSVRDAVDEWIKGGGLTRSMRIPAWTTLEQTVDRAKAEILADVASGIVPRSCASFSELHDYVDANGYGGAFEHDFDNEETDFWNCVQDTVDAWIKVGGLNA